MKSCSKWYCSHSGFIVIHNHYTWVRPRLMQGVELKTFLVTFMFPVHSFHLLELITQIPCITWPSNHLYNCNCRYEIFHKEQVLAAFISQENFSLDMTSSPQVRTIILSVKSGYHFWVWIHQAKSSERQLFSVITHIVWWINSRTYLLIFVVNCPFFQIIQSEYAL